MWYSNGYRIFLTLLNVSGLFPFQIKMENGAILYKSKPRLQAVLIGTYLVVLLSSQVYICFDKIVHHPVVNEWIFVFCTVIIFFVYGVLCVSNVICSSRIKDIYLKFTSIDVKIKGINLNCSENGSTFNYIIILQLTYLTSISIFLFLIYFYNYDLKYSVLFTLGFTLPKIVIVGHSFLYVNFFLFIRQYYVIFNGELEIDAMRKGALSKFLNIQKDFTALIRDVNYYYDRQNLFVVFIYVVWISYELYHLILLVTQEKIEGFNEVLVMFATSWILVQFSALVGMVAVYSMTLHEYERFIPLLINFAVRNKVDDEIQSFLKVSLFEKPFSEGSLFPLSFRLLFTIMGIFATFIAFLTGVSKDL